MIKIAAFFACLVLSGAIPQINAAELTVSQLKNSQYFIPGWEDETPGEWVQLKDGKYNRNEPDNVLIVEIVDIALGQLPPEKKPAAAVVYGYGTGGTGFFVMLGAVIDDQGKLKHSALVDLEDRVKINSLSIKSGKIVVDMLVHGPHDPAPFPTVRKIAAYTLVGNKLVEK